MITILVLVGLKKKEYSIDGFQSFCRMVSRCLQDIARLF